MTVTARESLGDASLNRVWYLDVNTGTTGTPVWTPVNAISEFKDGLEVDDIDVSDFSSDGWADSQGGTKSWSVELKVWRKRRRTVVAYDPGQEALRNLNGETAHVRFYEMGGSGNLADSNAFPRDEAYEGYVSVKWSPDGGGFDAARSVTITLTGKGPRTSITHPSPNLPTWEATTAYSLAAKVTLGAGILEVTTAGTSGSSAPALPGAVNGTVTDGTVTWKRIA